MASGGVPGGGRTSGGGGEGMTEGGGKVICLGAAIATPAKQSKSHITHLPNKLQSEHVPTYLPKGTDKR